MTCWKNVSFGSNPLGVMQPIFTVFPSRGCFSTVMVSIIVSVLGGTSIYVAPAPTISPRIKTATSKVLLFFSS
jgi:hypothetical protein